MAIKRLSLFQRPRALVLLKNGKSANEIVQILQKRYHPTESVSEVKKRYFPLKGVFAVSRLRGASREEILGSLGKMKAHIERARVHFVAHNKESAFARTSAERGRKYFISLNKDPARAERARVRLRNLRKDSNFKKKLADGIARRWNTYWLRVSVEGARRGVTSALGDDVGKRRVIPAITEGALEEVKGKQRFVPPTSESSAGKLKQIRLQKEKVKVITDALQSLSEPERNVVDLVFGFSQDVKTVGEAAVILGISVWEADGILTEALKKLLKNKKLRELK